MKNRNKSVAGDVACGSGANGGAACGSASGVQPGIDFPLRYYRIAIGIFFFLQGTVFATWTAHIPDIKKALGLSDALLGTILFCFPLGQLVSVPLSGYLVQKFSSRKVLLCVALLYPLSLVGIGLMPSRWSLAAMLFFLGAVANLHNLSVNTQAVSLEKRYGRSIIGTFHGLWSLAGFAAGLVSSFLAVHHVEPLTHFCGVWALGLLVVLALHRFLLREDLGSNSPAASDSTSASEPHKEAATFNIFKGMDRYLCLLGFLAFGCMLCEGSVYDWASVYFEQSLRVEPAFIRSGYTGCMLAMAAMRFLSDAMVNSLGAVRVVRLSGFVMSAGFLLAVVLPYLVPATIGFVLVGIGVSSVVPVCYGMVKGSRSMSAGRAINAVSTIGFFGFVAGPPLMGYISEWIGLRFAFALVACIGLATGLLASKLKRG